jgi:hypothetical protein
VISGALSPRAVIVVASFTLLIGRVLVSILGKTASAEPDSG